ncbi:MAG: protease complex subunit PrcB family protein [bacterium]
MKISVLVGLIAALFISGLQAFAVTAVSTDLELRRGEDVQKAAFKMNAGCYVRPLNDKESLLIASMGQMMNGGYSINIKKAVETDHKITIDVVQTSPGPDGMVTMALTWPQDAVAIKKSDKPIVFSVVSYSGKRVSESEMYYIPAQTFNGYGETDDGFGTKVINDEKSWKEIWAKIETGKPAPVIDFEKYTAAAICLGGKNNGKDLSIKNIQTQDAVLHVFYILNQQPENAVKNNAYTIAILPKYTDKILFEEAVVTKTDGGADCMAPELQ